MLEDHWENAGLGWDFWCLLGAGPENGGKKFLLGTGAGIWKNSTGPTLVLTQSVTSTSSPVHPEEQLIFAQTFVCSQVRRMLEIPQETGSI